jgi:outer membrane protein OmpA-like peptidoglycan-associated protein
MFGAYPLRLPAAKLAEMRERADEVVYEAMTPAADEPSASLVMSRRPIRVLDHFDFNRAEVTRGHVQFIDDAACHILAGRRKGGPIRRVRIVGHTDSTGGPWHNRRLGWRRAAAVARRLRRRLEQVAPGITAGMRFFVETAGATRPVASNRRPLGRAENRRVEIFIEVERRRPRPIVRDLDLEADALVPGPPRPPRPRVVFVPGIMGSVLLQTGSVPLFEAEVLWGTSRMLWWRRSAAATALWEKRLTQGNGLDIRGNVTTDVPPRKSKDGLVDLPTVDPYGGFLTRLRKQANADLLVFPYDWRLANDANASELESVIQMKWFPTGFPEQLPPESRITIFAHSMGGLVSRAFIESRLGHRVVKQLVTAGTPHQGAPGAFTNLIGRSTPLPTKVMPAPMQLALTQLCASVLQLLPEYDFVRLLAGLESRHVTYASRLKPHPTGTSVAAVRNMLRSLFQPRPGGYPSLSHFLVAKNIKYYCIGSEGLPTTTAFNGATNALEVTQAGDGTVPVISATCPQGPVTLGGPPCGVKVNVTKRVLRGVEHQRLFEDRTIQDFCLGLLEDTAWAAELARELLPELAGV